MVADLATPSELRNPDSSSSGRKHGRSSNKREATGAETHKSLILRLHDWQDKRSWNAVYRNYHKLVYAVARQSGLTEAEAWDVVQETFLSLAKQSLKGRYNPNLGSFKSWLLHITHWRIQDQLRHRSREADDSVPSDLPDLRSESFDKLWEREWQRNLTRAAVARVKLLVSPRQFQIYDFYVLQGMTVEEVCRKLGVNAAQVYLAKHRVGVQLRREIVELSQERQ